MPRRLRTLAVPLCLAASVAVAVAGCGGDAQPAGTPTGTTEAPSATPTPYSADQLSAAMPTDAELPDGYTITLQCPGGDDCGPGEVDNAYVVVSRTGQEAEDFFTVGLTEFPDAASATDTAERTRTDRDAHVGDFNLPAERTEEGLTPGRLGSGELADAAVEGWSGYRFLSTYQYLDAEGAAGATTTEGYLLLVRGTTMAAVQVNVPGDAAAEVGDRLDAEMQALFNRL